MQGRAAPVMLETSKRSPTLFSSALLAVAGGFLDGFAYVGHGHVFANAMTGNVVLFGIDCVSGSWRTGLHHLPPIVSFLVGIFVARWLQLEGVRRRVRDPHIAALTVEIGILFVLSLLPGTTPDFWITTSIAFAASVQIGTFREVNGRSYNSTFTTGNLRTLSDGAFDWYFGGRSAESARIVRDFSVICLAFLLGATAGGFAAGPFGNHALWFADALLLAAAAVIWPHSSARTLKSTR